MYNLASNTHFLHLTRCTYWLWFKGRRLIFIHPHSLSSPSIALTRFGQQ